MALLDILLGRLETVSSVTYDSDRFLLYSYISGLENFRGCTLFLLCCFSRCGNGPRINRKASVNAPTPPGLLTAEEVHFLWYEF